MIYSLNSEEKLLVSSKLISIIWAMLYQFNSIFDCESRKE